MHHRSPRRSPRRVGAVAALALALLAPVPTGAPAVAQPGAPAVAAAGDRGAWSVQRLGEDRWRVAWRSPSRLPVTGDRPTVVGADDLALVGTPVVADDGRTVAVTVTAPSPPTPGELDVVLSGRPLDEPARVEAPAAAGGWTPPARDLLGVDPGEPGDLRVVSDDYDLAPVRLPGLPEPVAMTGHVVQPAVRAPDRPLVLLLHGRHGYCFDPRSTELTWDWPCAAGSRPVPSHRGYDYLQRLLASQGHVTVSVAANGVDAQDGALADAGAAARARLVRAHLDRWAAWVARGDREADLGRVVLVGHSRGGEGVARAAVEIPLSAAYRVVGQVLVAPTAFARQATPYVPTVTLLPSCDGDVTDLQGQAYTDGGRDLVADDTALKSSLLLVGANHNWFNTEWTPGLSQARAEDDWWGRSGVCAPRSPARLRAATQRQVAEAYVGGAVRLFARADAAVLPMYDGSPVRVASTGDAVVLSHAVGGRRLRRPGVDAAPVAAGSTRAFVCRGTTPVDRGPRQCGRTAGDASATPHWPLADPPLPSASALEVSWARARGRAPGAAGLAFAAPLDLGAAASLDLRVVVDNRVGDARVGLRVTDATGAAALLRPRTLSALPHGPRWYAGKYWAQTLRVDAGELAGVDAARVVSVELVPRSRRGRVWVLDAAARPAALPPVPARRAPLVDLGEVRWQEGAGRQVAEVPYTLTGTPPVPGSFRVYADGAAAGSPGSVDVRVPAGASRGVVRWPYAGNRRDSLRQVHLLTGYATAGLVVRDHLGRLVVRDDDPAPRVRLVRTARAVAEGGRARWRLRLSAPVDYDLSVVLNAVAGRAGRAGATPVRVDDVGRRWLRRWVWFRPGTNPPLHRAQVGYYRSLPAGRTSLAIGVPLRDDRRVEGREAVTLRARTYERPWRSGPVTVFVRRGR